MNSLNNGSFIQYDKYVQQVSDGNNSNHSFLDQYLLKNQIFADQLHKGSQPSNGRGKINSSKRQSLFDEVMSMNTSMLRLTISDRSNTLMSNGSG